MMEDTHTRISAALATRWTVRAGHIFNTPTLFSRLCMEYDATI